MDRFYRWVWNELYGYTLNISTEHIDEYLNYLAYQDTSTAYKSNRQKALQIVYKWRHHERSAPQWDLDITFYEAGVTQPRDFFTREECAKLGEAALKFRSVPSYSNLIPAERDRWKRHLAQRFEKRKTRSARITGSRQTTGSTYWTGDEFDHWRREYEERRGDL